MFGGQPPLPKILGQTDRVGAHRFSVDICS